MCGVVWCGVRASVGACKRWCVQALVRASVGACMRAGVCVCVRSCVCVPVGAVISSMFHITDARFALF